MVQTTNLGLQLHGEGDADLALPFLDWREAMNGTDAGSNMQKIDAAYGDLKTRSEICAPTFDNTQSYAEGNYVWQAGVLYRFTEAHSSGTPWIGTDAEAVSTAIMDTLGNLIVPGEDGIPIRVG